MLRRELRDTQENGIRAAEANNETALRKVRAKEEAKRAITDGPYPLHNPIERYQSRTTYDENAAAEDPISTAIRRSFATKAITMQWQDRRLHKIVEPPTRNCSVQIPHKTNLPRAPSILAILLIY